VQIGVASSSSVGVPVLRALLESHHKVDFVITNPQKQSGRGKLVTSNDFHNFAKGQNIKVLTPSNSSELLSLLRQQSVDVIVTIAYGQLIKPESLVIPKYGWLNIHFSQLPRWRGASPVQSAILAGDVETGISIFLLDEGMDTGPIYLCVDDVIRESDTTGSILNRLSNVAAREITSLLDQISQGLLPKPQKNEGVCHARKFTKEDGKLDSTGSVSDFLRKVRALGENPGTWLTFRGEKIKIDDALPVQIHNDSSPAATLISTKKALYLMLSDGAVELTRVTPSGKKMMSGAEFARGARIKDGEIVE
jgi:methionyl-tRNA formyltransferase